MTIPGFIVLSSLIGSSVAYSARVQIRTLQKSVFTARYFLALMMFEGMILVPIGIYFAAFYPDWSWMYLLNTAKISAAVTTMAIAAYPVAAILGYLVGYYSAKSSSDWITLIFTVFMFIGLIGLFVVAPGKMFTVGSYQQFHRAVGTEPLSGTSLLPSMLFAFTGIIVCWFYLLYNFVQEGRAFRQSF